MTTTAVDEILQDFAGDEKGMCTIEGEQLATVTEPGLYRLMFMSPKPEAKAFKRWVFHKVLPSIRRHGCYPPPDDLMLAGEGRAVVRIDKKTIRELAADCGIPLATVYEQEQP